MWASSASKFPTVLSLITPSPSEAALLENIWGPDVQLSQPVSNNRWLTLISHGVPSMVTRLVALFLGHFASEFIGKWYSVCCQRCKHHLLELECGMDSGQTRLKVGYWISESTVWFWWTLPDNKHSICQRLLLLPCIHHVRRKPFFIQGNWYPPATCKTTTTIAKVCHCVHPSIHPFAEVFVGRIRELQA